METGHTRSTKSVPMKNALTIDLEDYYHVTAFADRLGEADWDSLASRVEKNTATILEWLQAAKCRATFFALGWIAEKHPHLIGEIARCGHEIACHSYKHRLVHRMTPEEFREDTRRARNVLEDAGGARVCGYRAPSFSITRESLWAFEVLAGLGFTYDSSIFPVEHVNYGVPDAPRVPHRIETPSGTLLEFPMTTLELGGRRSPLAGGAYLRILPYWYTRWGIRFLNEQEKTPVCVYIHPWELDPEQPRLEGSPTARLRHYLGLRSTPRKVRNLLRDFEFCPLGSLATQFLPASNTVAHALD